jgi:outer membrane lipoprotein-sorting protein
MALRTPKWIALALGLSLSVALLALAACSGGDSTSTSTTATAPAHNTNTQSPNNNATRTEQATATSGSSSADIASQLAALGGNIKQATGKVTYTSTDSSGTTSTITFYSKPPNSRFDSTSADGSTTAYIQTPQTTYICSSDAAQQNQTCLAQPGTGTGSAGLGLFGSFFSPALVDALTAAAQAQGIEIKKTSETIAGTDASCFEGTFNGSTEKFCFSGDGVMLAEQTTDSSGTTGLTATAFSTSVSDSDFQPPYPVTTIPVIPTG